MRSNGRTGGLVDGLMEGGIAGLSGRCAAGQYSAGETGVARNAQHAIRNEVDAGKNAGMVADGGRRDCDDTRGRGRMSGFVVPRRRCEYF